MDLAASILKFFSYQMIANGLISGYSGKPLTEVVFAKRDPNHPLLRQYLQDTLTIGENHNV
jgi:hypothetical protein